MRLTAAGVAAAVLLAGAPAAAQTASAAPGPWVLDVRAATSSVPGDLAFYPTSAASVVPARGFGADIGGHVYLFIIGPARIGLGGNFLVIRSTAEESESETAVAQRLTLSLRTIGTQVSANFGSRDGWSYLSAGVGTASLKTRVEGEEQSELESGRVRAVNVGGGARWFITDRLAFGFDLRGSFMAAGDGTPRARTFAVNAGLSVR